MIVIPAIDLVGGKCVRLYQGDYEKQTTYAEDPVDQALRFQAAGFRRLHVVDLEGARHGCGRNRKAIRDIVGAVRIPVQVGGGIRKASDVKELLASGARYLILGTVALTEPLRVTEWVTRWGSAPFLVSLDLKGGRLRVQGWTEESPLSLEEVIARCAGWGIGTVICTDVERDGTLEQPNYPTYQALLEKLPQGMLLMAAGGISRLEHLAALHHAGVAGAVVGKALYEADIPWERLVHVG